MIFDHNRISEKSISLQNRVCEEHMQHGFEPRSSSSGALPSIIRSVLAIVCAVTFVVLMAGCSAGKSGLLTITPQQYFYSAKEKLEVIDERSYEIKDLEEIIRVFENAEKDAKSSDIMDKSRLYLTLTNTLKARKEYRGNLMKGQYLANRAEPFYQLDMKPIQETLRTAKKWLRACDAQFKSDQLKPDLEYVKGMYYTMKMLTQTGSERKESLWTAVGALRRCLGMAPDYKADFRLFGRPQGPREVRMQLIETLALGGEIAEAYGIVSEYAFTPTNPRLDYPWLHRKGLVLAMMGRLPEAAELLSHFKIVSPQDYPQVDEALWILEGVYDRLKENTNEPRWGTEAKIVSSMLKTLKGPYSKDKYTTASHLFPKWLPGDETFFSGLIAFIDGDFAKARPLFTQLSKHGLLSRGNRLSARVLTMENELYAGQAVTDEILEDVLGVSIEKDLTPLLRERIGFLLARYVMAQDTDYKKGKLEGEGQTFIKSILGKPWVLRLTFERGKMQASEAPGGVKSDGKEKKRRDRRRKSDIGEDGLRKELRDDLRIRAGSDSRNELPLLPPVGGVKERGLSRVSPISDSEKEKEYEKKLDDASQEESPKREPASLLVELYANHPDDWITSADIHLLALPQMSLIGKGHIVGREDEGKGWIFKGEDIDELKRHTRYLAIFEFANSDSEKSIQGLLFDL
ncbi:MAG: hypothetical protein HQM09_00155 [Candidatus Riflebacteria bacterium]|nr:hypothetical protein [Candidatus Riflebacteria bacterium]